MIEKAIVISTEGKYARIKVRESEACESCPARSFCVGQKEKEGTILAENHAAARPGDKVVIEVPESRYTKTLIRVFASLLAGALVGLAFGYLVSFALHLHPSFTSAAGLIIGILLTGLFLYTASKKKKEYALYPQVISVEKRKVSGKEENFFGD
ncbi:MAG: SoxR reducing system RseC family protein [Candidatus Aminicenantales bacterium]